ncbi:hypothetical protein WJX73_005554 [Symbiochloris irregularis]|uniref:GTPase Obg n=1 Tax=Symbiochloris irregularis TaxID=706552 RepID=A0AAW1PM04_9CHLO
MRYFDTAKIHIKAGDGGRGCVAFRREKHVPRGGPSGGNGGTGGSIWVQVDDSLNSLSSFRHHVHFRAGPGIPGSGSCKHGANGESITISVPPGTIIRSSDPDAPEPVLAEMLKPGQRALLLCGGRGGRGNASFKTMRNTAPQLAEVGEVGGESWLEMELRLVADVGLVGAPNAGKSTLLSTLSAARPKVADYPFTTLTPNLGVCDLDFRSTVIADIPGLLEGAHTGHGLGHEFLRHCQRCRVLVQVVDGSSPDPLGDFDAIRAELELFNPELVNKPLVVAYNKMDLPDSADYWDDVRVALAERGISSEDCFAVSAATGQGNQLLVRRLHALLDSLPREEWDEDDALLDMSSLASSSGTGQGRPMDDFEVLLECKSPRIWRVEGQAIERFAQMTNWNYYESALRFQKVLEASGINAELRNQGVQEQDTVCIGEHTELEWSDDQSEKSLYGVWMDERKAQGRVMQGSARWPHKGS